MLFVFILLTSYSLMVFISLSFFAPSEWVHFSSLSWIPGFFQVQLTEATPRAGALPLGQWSGLGSRRQSLYLCAITMPSELFSEAPSRLPLRSLWLYPSLPLSPEPIVVKGMRFSFTGTSPWTEELDSFWAVGTWIKGGFCLQRLWFLFVPAASAAPSLLVIWFSCSVAHSIYSSIYLMLLLDI